MGRFELIKDYIVKYKFRYIFGIVFLLGVDILQLVLPRIFGIITDLLKAGDLTSEDLAMYALIIVLLSVGIAAFRFLWRYLVFGVSRIIETELRDKFYYHLQKLSVNYYNNHKTGDLMAHATNDINNIRMALGQGIVLVIDSALIPVVAVIMMLYTAGPRLTLACFSPLLVLGVIITFNVKFMHAKIEKMQEAFSELTEKARENFSGIRVIKSFVQEKEEIKRFEKANLYNKEMNLKFVHNMRLLFPLVTSVSALSFAVALWYGGTLVIKGEISLGDFISFNSYLGMLVWPTAALGWVTSIFQRGSVSLKRVNEILNEKPEVQDNYNPEDVHEIYGSICFRNLTFTYPGSSRPALLNINLNLQKGKTLAVVGKTGSGKTTLVNLILRLYNVEENTLLIDGTDILRIPLHILRRSIGCVPQDTFLFSTTIRENIDFFLSRDEQSIVNAAKAAKVYDNIMEFPQKFDTIVGERGVTLSGGQKQRVAIARAILRGPAILILDDSLSAVDTHTEEEILKDLKSIMKQRTSIIVSHRISTIKDADEIIVLEEGEIIERGSHEALLEKHGVYYELYQKQLLAEQIAGEE